MKITNEIKEKILEEVDNFNKENNFNYKVRFRGQFLYLDKIYKNWLNRSMTTHIGRLEYFGDMNTFKFSVFKYSSEIYDPNEYFFPGSEHLDGTILGALKTGLELY